MQPNSGLPAGLARDGRPAPLPGQSGQWAPQQPEPPAFPPGPYARAGGPTLQATQQDQTVEDEIEFEEEPRRSRKWLIAVALIGSIGAGSALAYAYKQFVAPRGADRGQVVRAPQGPAKVAPQNSGGKQFANSDSRLNNRLPPEGGNEGANSGFTDSSGVRRVPTVAVGREPAPGGPPIQPGAASPVPGMTIVAGGGGFPSPGALPSPSLEPPTARAPSPPAAVQPPSRIAAAPPPVQQAAPPPPSPKAPTQRAAAVPPPADPDVAPPATRAAPAAPRTPRPTGFVAVLGYQKSQMEAMKMMADLQQKYETLRDRKLEIVQSDGPVGNLGVIYRVVVGPRTNIATARSVCTELQQAGMPQNRCYTMGQ